MGTPTGGKLPSDDEIANTDQVIRQISGAPPLVLTLIGWSKAIIATVRDQALRIEQLEARLASLEQVEPPSTGESDHDISQ